MNSMIQTITDLKTFLTLERSFLAVSSWKKNRKQNTHRQGNGNHIQGIDRLIPYMGKPFMGHEF